MTAPPRQTWVDLLKGGAILWILVNHAAEAVFGSPAFGNPSAGWPPLSERVAQVAPISGWGWFDIPANLFRYTGWLGDQGVQLFIVASGFGLTWSLLAKGADHVDGKAFFLRRAARLLPLWWGAHLAFCVVRWSTGVGPFPTDGAFWLSFVGVRFTPGTYYYAVPAWWYVGLQIQLYVALPLLWTWLRRWGGVRLLLVSCVVGFACRAVGFALFDGYIDAWERGAVFITRLPEFVLGMALAEWVFTRPETAAARLRHPATLAAAVLLWALGTAASFTAPGIVVFTFATAAGLIPPAYAMTTALSGRAAAVLGWFGRHAYALYLVHHPIVLLLMDPTTSPAWFMLTLAAATGLSVLAALALEQVVEAGDHVLRNRLVAVSVTGVLVVGLYAAELGIRRSDPQEVLGWGERPSLQADADVGWKLRPDSETHLRWASYDYTMKANALGFPGPDPAAQKVKRRVVVLGDAFSSAEGVDTADAWPRLLGPEVEVVNLAITGHGPNQYARVAKTFFAELRPDVVVVASFINDFEDARTATTTFHALIGFHLAPPSSLGARIRPLHLRAWFAASAWSAARAAVSGQPTRRDLFYSGLHWLRRDAPFWSAANVARVGARLGEVDAAAKAVGARVELVLVPARAQVCEQPVDSAVYDVDKPQATMTRLAKALGWRVSDLRPALRGVSPCPYQRGNLHFTRSGHRRTAEAVASTLRPDGD